MRSDRALKGPLRLGGLSGLRVDDAEVREVDGFTATVPDLPTGGQRLCEAAARLSESPLLEVQDPQVSEHEPFVRSIPHLAEPGEGPLVAGPGFLHSTPVDVDHSEPDDANRKEY